MALPAGDIRVEVADSLAIPNQPTLLVLGRFDPLARTIYINGKIQDTQQRYKTLYHEVCHATLIDAGLQNILYAALDRSAIELLCDAFATQRMAELSRPPRG